VGTPKNCNPLKIILLSLIVFFVVPQVNYAQTATLDLTWNQNSEGDLKGYKVYYRAPAGAYGDPKDVGNITKYTLLGLESQKNYFVAITAYDTSGNESNKSEEISGVAQLSPNTSTTTPITTSTPGPVTTTSTPGPVTTSTPNPVTTTTPGPIATTTIRDDTHLSSTVLINNGDKVTQAENVTLTLFATDKDGNELGKDALMILKDDSLDWSDPEPYATTKNWVLSQGKGDKTVSVRFGHTADNWLSEAQDQVRLVGTQKQLKPDSILSSSEFTPFWGKDNVADGDPLTFWSSFLAFYWGNESITLDLGEVKLIESVNMYATVFFNTCYFPVNFQIELSKNNIDWEELYTLRNYTPKPAKSDSWNLNSYEGRYIKIYITKARIFFFFFYLTQIAEIEVYGYDLPEDQQSEKPDDTPLVTPGKPDDGSKEEKEGETPGEEAGGVQGAPGIPGKPAIIFSNQPYKGSVRE
jgi:hypothetical protein